MTSIQFSSSPTFFLPIYQPLQKDPIIGPLFIFQLIMFLLTAFSHFHVYLDDSYSIVHYFTHWWIWTTGSLLLYRICPVNRTILDTPAAELTIAYCCIKSANHEDWNHNEEKILAPPEVISPSKFPQQPFQTFTAILNFSNSRNCLLSHILLGIEGIKRERPSYPSLPTIDLSPVVPKIFS